MSLKGIDAQIMLQRATDFAKESSLQLKHVENEASFKAMQTKLQADQLIKDVQGNDRSEMVTINPDDHKKEERPREEYKPKEKKEEKPSEPEDPEMVFREANVVSKERVDIRV